MSEVDWTECNKCGIKVKYPVYEIHGGNIPLCAVCAGIAMEKTDNVYSAYPDGEQYKTIPRAEYESLQADSRKLEAVRGEVEKQIKYCYEQGKIEVEALEFNVDKDHRTNVWSAAIEAYSAIINILEGNDNE